MDIDNEIYTFAAELFYNYPTPQEIAGLFNHPNDCEGLQLLMPGENFRIMN